MKSRVYLSLLFALFAGQLQGQCYDEECCGNAYSDGSYAPYLAIGLPIVMIVAVAVVVATTKEHHLSSPAPAAPVAPSSTSKSSSYCIHSSY